MNKSNGEKQTARTCSILLIISSVIIAVICNGDSILRTFLSGGSSLFIITIASIVTVCILLAQYRLSLPDDVHNNLRFGSAEGLTGILKVLFNVQLFLLIFSLSVQGLTWVSSDAYYQFGILFLSLEAINTGVHRRNRIVLVSGTITLLALILIPAENAIVFGFQTLLAVCLTAPTHQ